MKLYRAILTSKEWVLLNTIDRYINHETSYRANALKYLNVGESMIEKLEIYFFKSEQETSDYIYSLLEKLNHRGVLVYLAIESEEI